MTDAPNVVSLALALRQVQRDFGLAQVSATADLGHDRITLTVSGADSTPLLVIENADAAAVVSTPDVLT